MYNNNIVSNDCKILIIGLGLIGGSLAEAILKYTNVHKIYYYDTNKIKHNDIQEIDFALKYDIIFLACPLEIYHASIDIINKYSHKNTIISDVGSVQKVIHFLHYKHDTKNIVGGHPIAGSEKSCFENRNYNLFKGKKFIYTVKENQQQNQSTEIIKNIWQKIGVVDIECLEYQKHDDIYAKVSHIPQFLLFMYKDMESNNINNEQLKQFTRITQSSKDVWTSIFAINASAIRINMNIILTKLVDLDKNQYNRMDNKLKEYTRAEFNSNFIREHIISYLLASIVNEEESKYAGNGFKDTISMLLQDEDFAKMMNNNEFKKEIAILKKVYSNLPVLK